MPAKIDIPIGTRFGWLTVIAARKGGWVCQCACGKTVTPRGYELRRRSMQSCGCKIALQRKTYHHSSRLKNGRILLMSVGDPQSDERYNDL